MKYTFNLLVGILIFIPFTKVDAQVFATGQANTSYIYPIIDENGPERLFTGLSAEIGAEGETMSILLKSGVYIPRNYILINTLEIFTVVMDTKQVLNKEFPFMSSVYMGVII